MKKSLRRPRRPKIKQRQIESFDKEEIGYVEALKLVMESNQRTVELLLNASKDRGTIAGEMLDQDDQRIKVVELDKLEEPTEESASIVCGDWIHWIRPVIKNLSKRTIRYWTILESVVEKRYKRYLVSSTVG